MKLTQDAAARFTQLVEGVRTGSGKADPSERDIEILVNVCAAMVALDLVGDGCVRGVTPDGEGRLWAVLGADTGTQLRFPLDFFGSLEPKET